MDKLKEKNTLELCINLDEYEAKLEQLSIFAQKMSTIDWTIESGAWNSGREKKVKFLNIPITREGE